MTFTAELQRRIQAMDMRCYRKILHISCKDLVTSEEVRAKTQQAIEPHENLLMIVKRRILQTKEEVGRHQGMDRPGVRQFQRAVENREKWRQLVAKSSVVAQRPSRSRD